ncbi:CocE/NonD family hydrolase [Nocardia cyriacigeorgica]|nr:CocE/NonD family hydrolase [Nocardia cyriacigeorgica]MBF6435380.1 CocE/NonD family hydrolase [Nocardia cyriacigeorgica]MBF6454539.1 CocE/NonD family hydrolase [Nocardia cyriacigeorgica]MBF6478476.1 CocE/NonD family hydrolase [Nocardia cyriacigeorgica]MBF6552433.1 CocE/NonD family hydrolase [Nocardia cyriacigeorgica]
MHTVESLPYRVREIENIFIPMRDGARLAARVWRPVADTPLPAVFEYIPYRKRDLTRARDALNHPYLAGHGYVSVRVDLRGSGDSDGVLTDEYLPTEHQDACDVIEWLAAQPWCDGNVGMMGISWGGFNSLQVAAQRPPALKAVMSASATEDLYVDNMHYMGGCLLSDNLSEATVMFAFNSLPPDPDIVGDRWREMWHERLAGSGLWIEQWLRHQHRDDYWKRASVNEDYGAVRCPVLVVGGWADGYTNAIFRLLEHLEVPRLGIIGPWGHKYPHLGVPGPAIGFLQELVRWWDHWLKGVDTGIMDEPMLRAWMQDSVSPQPSYEDRPGRWVGEPRWPSAGIEPRHYVLGRYTLAEAPAEIDARLLHVQSPLSVGMFAGKWASYAATPDLPSDQREEDGGSLVFETEALEDTFEVLGLPSLELEVSADRPNAMVAARLSDVAPNGEATRVTYGLLNLTHRDGSADPRPLEPGRHYRVRVPLNGIAHSFPPGHRIRLSISSSYWPLAWPSPEPVMLTLVAGRSSLMLPHRPARRGDTEPRSFGAPEAAPPDASTRLQPGKHHWKVERDLASGVSTLEVENDQGIIRLDETGTRVRRATTEWFSFRGNDVTSVRGETRTVRRLERGSWRTEIVTRTVLRCTAEEFVIDARLDAYEIDLSTVDPRVVDQRVYSQNWHRRIPRDLV